MAEPADTPGSLLDRTDSQRQLEYRYRFGQSVVFGLPVVALHSFGRTLGGAEADRWVALFQALLAGWVVYVAATGMIAEGLMLMAARRRLPPGIAIDACVGVGAVVMYLAGIPRVAGLLAGHQPARNWPGPFMACVILLGVWTGLRWAKKKSAAG